MTTKLVIYLMIIHRIWVISCLAAPTMFCIHVLLDIWNKLKGALTGRFCHVWDLLSCWSLTLERIVRNIVTKWVGILVFRMGVPWIDQEILTLHGSDSIWGTQTDVGFLFHHRIFKKMKSSGHIAQPNINSLNLWLYI